MKYWIQLILVIFTVNITNAQKNNISAYRITECYYSDNTDTINLLQSNIISSHALLFLIDKKENFLLSLENHPDSVILLAGTKKRETTPADIAYLSYKTSDGRSVIPLKENIEAYEGSCMSFANKRQKSKVTIFKELLPDYGQKEKPFYFFLIMYSNTSSIFQIFGYLQK